MGFSSCDVHRGEWKISWERTCGNTTTEVGRHQEWLSVVAESKRVDETSRG